MAPTDYRPLSTVHPNEPGTTFQYDKGFTHETEKPIRPISFNRPGDLSYSLPRKPLPSSSTISQPEPRELVHSWYTSVTQSVLDIVICVALLAFFALALCAYSLSGKEVSAWGTSVQEWSLIVRNTFHTKPILH